MSLNTPFRKITLASVRSVGGEPGREHQVQLEAAGILQGRHDSGLQPGGRGGGREKWLDPGFASGVQLRFQGMWGIPERAQAKMVHRCLAWQLERRNCYLTDLGKIANGIDDPAGTVGGGQKS